MCWKSECGLQTISYIETGMEAYSRVGADYQTTPSKSRDEDAFKRNYGLSSTIVSRKGQVVHTTATARARVLLSAPRLIPPRCFWCPRSAARRPCASLVASPGNALSTWIALPPAQRIVCSSGYTELREQPNIRSTFFPAAEMVPPIFPGCFWAGSDLAAQTGSGRIRVTRPNP